MMGCENTKIIKDEGERRKQKLMEEILFLRLFKHLKNKKENKGTSGEKNPRETKDINRR